MKNLAKLLVMALLVGLFGVVAISSLLATPSVQTPLVATTSYNETTGIRWNEGFKVFEVFNANGISYIASNEYFDASGTKGISTENGMVKADGTKTYNIMQDIAYNPADTTNQETAFAGGTRHSITTGAVNGRGFILKNFPIIATATAGSALFRSNAGTIQNLILENPTYSTGTANTGILVYENKGTIDGCEVLAGAINTLNEISIAPIAYKGSGTIRNCTNKLNITTNGQFVAGLVVYASDLSLVSNKNFGRIRSNAVNSFAGGVAAMMTLGEVLDNANYADITANDAGGILGNCAGTTVKGNKNLGNISGNNTACGIVGGEVYTLRHSGNSNNGDVIATQTAEIYLGEKTSITPSEGIYYVPNAIPNSPATFMIESMTGLSYIGSNVYFDNTGTITNAEDPNSAPASSANATYIITKDIDYSVVPGRDNPLVIGAGSTVDGQDSKLTNFPVRLRSGTNNQLTALFDSIASTATVSNINLIADTRIPANVNSGAIGLLSYQNNGTIKNCVVSGGDINTTKSFNFGGVAYNYSGTTARFEDCTSTVNAKTGGVLMGGILAGNSTADNKVTMINCHFSGSLELLGPSANTYVGGIAGQAIGDFNNISATGSIALSEHKSGFGFVGGLFGGIMSYSLIHSGYFDGMVWLGSDSDSAIAIGGAFGMVNGGQSATVIGFRTSPETELSWISGGAVPFMGGVVGHGTGSGVVEGPVTLPDNTTINNKVGTVIWGAKVNATFNLWRDTGTTLGGIGGVLGGSISTSSNRVSNIMNSSINMKINIEDTDDDQTGDFPIGGVVGYCAGGPAGQQRYLVSDVKVNLRLILAETLAPNAYIGGLFGRINGPAVTVGATNCEFNGTIDDGVANSTNTGKTAGFIENTACQNVTCGGTGYANSGKHVGNGTVENGVVAISDAEAKSYYIAEFTRILTGLPASGDIATDLTLEDKALVGELEYLLNLIEKNDAETGTDNLLTSIITDEANSAWFASVGISSASDVKTLLANYQAQLLLLESPV